MHPVYQCLQVRLEWLLGYEELEKRDKLSLYLFWLRDETTRARALCEETRLQSSGRGRRNRAA
jgi:hypothetical protein